MRCVLCMYVCLYTMHPCCAVHHRDFVVLHPSLSLRKTHSGAGTVSQWTVATTSVLRESFFPWPAAAFVCWDLVCNTFATALYYMHCMSVYVYMYQPGLMFPGWRKNMRVCTVCVFGFWTLLLLWLLCVIYSMLCVFAPSWLWLRVGILFRPTLCNCSVWNVLCVCVYLCTTLT